MLQASRRCDALLWSCRVLYISIHRGNGFYPGTGHVEEVGVGDGRGFTLNVPWLKVCRTPCSPAS
jgi:acetoin utilization deacetylase AcuC-like enzyme